VIDCCLAVPWKVEGGLQAVVEGLTLIECHFGKFQVVDLENIIVAIPNLDEKSVVSSGLVFRDLLEVPEERQDGLLVVLEGGEYWYSEVGVVE
jgi:hypothetical protein